MDRLGVIELGKTQAENIGKSLRSKIVASQYVLYSSDLLRAKQTADFVGKNLNLKPRIQKELREINVGIDTPTPVSWFNEHKKMP